MMLEVTSSLTESNKYMLIIFFFNALISSLRSFSVAGLLPALKKGIWSVLEVLTLSTDQEEGIVCGDATCLASEPDWIVKLP
jgi:hypothetical protein